MPSVQTGCRREVTRYRTDCSAFWRPSSNYTARRPPVGSLGRQLNYGIRPAPKSPVKESFVVASRNIELRGVSVHNLKHIDLDIPQHQLVVVCGVSGSGKTSLALDTLYAEGQRRYIESFSLYTRQFLERLDKPQAERIDGLPAAIAVTRNDVSRSNRATIGTTTETIDYLRLLYSKIGRLVCPSCGRPVEKSSPQSAAEQSSRLPEGTRLMVGFAASPSDGESRE